MQPSLILAFIFACKKPPETAEPPPDSSTITVATETESETTASVDTVEDEDLDSQEPQEPQEVEVEGQGEPDYSTEINNATAMLDTDESQARMALEELENILKEKDDIPEVHYNIGVAHLKLNDVVAAKQAFVKSTEVDPAFSKSWYNLGVISERDENFQKAFDIYTQGLKHNVKDTDLIAGQIACLRKMGRHDEAIEFAQNALKEMPIIFPLTTKSVMSTLIKEIMTRRSLFLSKQLEDKVVLKMHWFSLI